MKQKLCLWEYYVLIKTNNALVKIEFRKVSVHRPMSILNMEVAL